MTCTEGREPNLSPILLRCSWQFVSLFYLSKKPFNSCPNGEQKRGNHWVLDVLSRNWQIVSFSFSFRQTGRSVHSTSLSRIFFSWLAKVCQVLCMYFSITPSPNFHVVENGRMFLEYKQRQKVECLPFDSRCHQLKTSCCFKEQRTAKNCTKARAARLSHLVCKVCATYPRIKLSGLEMKRKPRSHVCVIFLLS